MTDDPLIVALDHAAPDAARACVRTLAGAARRFKVGSALFTLAGPDVVRELVRTGHEVFLDLKFHDTPATVAGAVTAAAAAGASLLTLHAAGGSAMLAAARAAADRAARPPRLLAVTVLTSLGGDDWRQTAGPGSWSIPEAVTALARLSRAAGLDGVVCAAGEAAAVRAALGPRARVVVPGIRPAWSRSDHAGQTRTATPAEALAAGATDLVIGRVVTEAPDPRAALARVREEIGR